MIIQDPFATFHNHFQPRPAKQKKRKFVTVHRRTVVNVKVIHIGHWNKIDLDFWAEFNFDGVVGYYFPIGRNIKRDITVKRVNLIWIQILKSTESIVSCILKSNLYVHKVLLHCGTNCMLNVDYGSGRCVNAFDFLIVKFVTGLALSLLHIQNHES